MTLPAYVMRHVLPAAYALLPSDLASREATTLLMAIAFQESNCRQRRQKGGGPARGLWQFEQDGGVAGVLVHHASHPLLVPVLGTLAYPVFAETCHVALEHNDVLAAVFARLLLWTDPKPLPKLGELNAAYAYYDRNWRPGKKRPEDWPVSYVEAVRIVADES